MRPCSKGLIPSVAAIIRNAQNQVLMVRQHNGGLSLLCVFTNVLLLTRWLLLMVKL